MRERQGEIFIATQLMLRPGLAQTQAVLARELSGGTDEASRLFRQSVTLTRQLERNRVELVRLQDLARPSSTDLGRAAVLRASLEQTQKEQVATQAALAGFPRYRAVATELIPAFGPEITSATPLCAARSLATTGNPAPISKGCRA